MRSPPSSPSPPPSSGALTHPRSDGPAQIEVVKTRAQVESVPGKKLGSFGIARQIARNEGLRGFYIGGLMTAVHDSISSGIFFWSCASLTVTPVFASAALPPVVALTFRG